jgi:hypothetical protein
MVSSSLCVLRKVLSVVGNAAQVEVATLQPASKARDSSQLRDDHYV